MYEILTRKTHNDDGTEKFALLFLDLDEFKDVNDTLGHYTGDELLKLVGERLRKCVRRDDIIGRLGGDEFIIILNTASDRRVIQSIARSVGNSLEQEFNIEGHRINVSTSIGITLFPDDASTSDELLINADQAMYACKNSGSNGFCFFDEAMRDAMIQRNDTLRDLKLAIVNNQLELHFQPILSLSNHRIVKTEALIRWNHPERGLIPPNEFIRLAEESGQINEIGEWVFRDAAKHAAKWRREFSPEFQVSINASPLQFRDNGIKIDEWVNYLHELGETGDAIIVEITEGLLMETGSGVKSKLLSLRNAGIEVSIDDFGTGYSSLSYMKKFNIDYLKIDQSFVYNLSHDSEDMALCEAIIMMAHRLGCKVVAEGIETKTQRDLLKNASCDFGQGYLFAKPL
ncbi:UNVERIFIED_CONTAM: hypothetical protein GTU68_046256, partial [Idotea baltica]|nr:hypothetical protein [Idotea baltica]